MSKEGKREDQPGVQLQVNGVKPVLCGAVWSCVKSGEGMRPGRHQQHLLSCSREVSVPQASQGRGPSCVRFIQKPWNNRTEGDSETGAGAPQGGGGWESGAGPERGSGCRVGAGARQACLGKSQHHRGRPRLSPQ